MIKSKLQNISHLYQFLQLVKPLLQCTILICAAPVLFYFNSPFLALLAAFVGTVGLVFQPCVYSRLSKIIWLVARFRRQPSQQYEFKFEFPAARTIREHDQ